MWIRLWGMRRLRLALSTALFAAGCGAVTPECSFDLNENACVKDGDCPGTLFGTATFHECQRDVCREQRCSVDLAPNGTVYRESQCTRTVCQDGVAVDEPKIPEQPDSGCTRYECVENELRMYEDPTCADSGWLGETGTTLDAPDAEASDETDVASEVSADSEPGM